MDCDYIENEWVNRKRIKGGNKKMMRVICFEELEDVVRELFVEAVCPHCGRILISLVPDARNVVVFGCTMCGDIDNSSLFSVNGLLGDAEAIMEDIK